ncbi:Phosphatidic acid phosphatase type 2/haloperoxidase [Dillenia turbinata]|uniref:Phosphatidic acid phosphatase type 2/haloperoxidase n=1 Tax=Dillenia turbinata TaxID=194707 RepID=A0AAN8ZI23_9MAGN
MESIAAWQVAFLCGVITWIAASSYFNFTQKLRSVSQPWVAHRVNSGTHLILQIQKFQNGFLDALFSGMSCVVSVPFYTAFLPLLFWSGHGKLARQMTLLMVFCDYLGNCVKDVVSASRPSCPPVRRITATKDEEENTLEYGLPSSHTLNTVCLSGYLLHYVLDYTSNKDPSVAVAGISVVCLVVVLIGLGRSHLPLQFVFLPDSCFLYNLLKFGYIIGRIYLGMHSVIDVLGGLAMGLMILTFWLTVHTYIDDFIISGQNVTSFWATFSFLLLFAYPTPEFPTPSFEFHTAFNGVALGIVTGVQQTYLQFHHEDVARVFTPGLPILAFLGRMLVGIPTILIVKFCSKALAKWFLPLVSNALGLPIRSTNYIPALSGKKTDEKRQPGFAQKLLFFSKQDSFDVDTGIRFLQYAGLAWSVVDLVPTLFTHLNL